MKITYKLPYRLTLTTLMLFCLTLTSFIGSDESHALSPDTLNISNNCSQTQKVSYSGTLEVPTDTYDVYIRLPQRGQTANVSVYAQANFSGSCALVGNLQTSGDTWTKVGSVSDLQESTPAIFQVSSDELGSVLNANRPSIMLISQTDPTCVPTTQCFVSIDGTKGYIRAPGTLPNEDSLHIIRAINPSQDKIKSVTYYVDDAAVYSKPTLMNFDLRYVSLSSQTLSRVVLYQSGQEAVITTSPPDSFSDTFFNFLFRIFVSHPNSLVTLGGIVGLSIIVGLLFGILHALKKHRTWELNHGFIHEKYILVTDASRRKAFLKEHAVTIVRRIVLSAVFVIGGFGLILISNTYLFTFFKVDGHSMESTFKDGSEVFINKIPVSWKQLNKLAYTPKRGDVVILHAVYGIGESDQPTETEKYIIKRVIGLPGERVIIKNGIVTVYNEDHPSGFQPDSGSSWQKTMHNNDTNENIDVTLNEDELFVSGDNRPVSIDSRFNGPIKTSEVVGQVLFKL